MHGALTVYALEYLSLRNGAFAQRRKGIPNPPIIRNRGRAHFSLLLRNREEVRDCRNGRVGMPNATSTPQHFIAMSQSLSRLIFTDLCTIPSSKLPISPLQAFSPRLQTVVSSLASRHLLLGAVFYSQLCVTYSPSLRRLRSSRHHPFRKQLRVQSRRLEPHLQDVQARDQIHSVSP